MYIAVNSYILFVLIVVADTQMSSFEFSSSILYTVFPSDYNPRTSESSGFPFQILKPVVILTWIVELVVVFFMTIF